MSTSLTQKRTRMTTMTRMPMINIVVIIIKRYPKCTSKIVLEEVTILATVCYPECVSENAKKALQETFESRPGATVKHKNRAVTAKTLELVAKAHDIDSSPIIFSKITSRLFIDFLHC